MVASLAMVVLATCGGAADDGRNEQTDPQWSGYVSVGRTYTDVSARFTVPSVSCPEPNTNASFWVGLDGFDSPTVEQIGVEALCRDGVARYSAWWQAFPATSQPLDIVVVPGHEIVVRVSVGAAGVRFELRDITVSVAFEKTLPVTDATFTSAEVIAEQSGASQGPLSDFDEVVFHEATVNGETFGRADPLALVMTNASGSPRVAVSPLSAGDAFAVRWLAA
ncbi:MAG: hypothetical protein QOI99_2413 [Actinomycetota bacterium]|nr:hypothetical protein [Actinomycetota bacterium]